MRLSPSPSATVTITIAAPAVVSWTAHGLSAGAPIDFTTTGALPTGLVASGGANSCFYVSSTGLGANSFQVSTTYANAIAGTSQTTSGTQSGTHTCSVRAGGRLIDLSGVPVTFTASSANITWTAHGLSVGDLVGFTGAILPAGLNDADSYWVHDVVNANTIKVSQDYPLDQYGNSSGSAVTWASVGSSMYGVQLSNMGLTTKPLLVYNVPLAVPIAINNIMAGSRLRLADASNNELYNGLAISSTASFAIKFAGTAYLTVRYGAGGYQEYTTTMIVDGLKGASVYIEQQLDGTA
jgi:hypothetical protein